MFYLVLSVVFSIFCGVTSEFHPIERRFGETSELNNLEIKYRLPNNTKPLNYDITLITNIDKNEFNFSGVAVIGLLALETSSNITLHARQLTIKSVQLATAGGFMFKSTPFTYDRTTEFLTIQTQNQLQKDLNYILIIDYMGELRNDPFGFYRSSYVNSKGETKWLATSQFQPTDARHAFPCYDEPGLKAKFTIHIEHGESYTAFSNMREKRNPAVNGKVITDFEQTPLMSTYLIAFLVSDFEYNEFIATNEFPTPQRVFANREQINQTSYSLEEGVTILQSIANYLRVPFTLSKLDHASIPDTGVGAMENWGLITYPQKRMIFDPNVHLADQQLDICTTIAHEEAHQWFGNLVSPKWWSSLWRNEGFATLFQATATGLVHPNWLMFDHFVVTEVQTALRVDAQSATHSMTFYVESPEELENLFDDITYSKAGSVIRMFMHAIGEYTFKKGLNYYLTNNSFGTVEEDMLFEQLDSAAKEDKALSDSLNIKDLFGSWSNQKGFPLLKVNRNYKDGSVTLYQEKYNEVFKPNESDSTTWWIPYNFASAKSPIFEETTPFGWLAKGQREIVIKSNDTQITWSNNDWLLFNRQQTGFYRILYDTENYNLLTEELNNGNLSKIHPINRAQILDDLHDFVTTGRLSSDVLCNTLTYLNREQSFAPWETARKVIDEWNHQLRTSGQLSNFRNIVARLVEPNYRRWTLEESEREDLFDRLSRNTAVNLACRFGVSQCLEETYIKFKKMLNGLKLPPNIRGLVIANGIRIATDQEIEKLWQIYLNSSNNDERTEIISSIGNIPKDSTVQLYLEKTIENVSSKGVSARDRLLLVTSIINSDQRSASFVIQFLSKNLGKVNTTIGSLPVILKSIAHRILAKDEETQFNELLERAKQQNLINHKDIEALKSITKKKLAWQQSNLQSFEVKFFDGECKGNWASNLVAVPVLILLLLCVLHWNRF